MTDFQRQSPVVFTPRALKTEVRNGWPVALEYQNEGDGPYLVDLSHQPRWDVQDSDLMAITPDGLKVPDSPGSCNLSNGILINRMNRTQAAVWHLMAEEIPMPPESAYTDVTEATVFLALLGPNLFKITEKLTALDLHARGNDVPFLLQGPFSHVPCQIVIFSRSTNGHGCLLLTCSRGYGHSMVQGILSAGAEYNLRPAGETRFTNFITSHAD